VVNDEGRSGNERPGGNFEERSKKGIHQNKRERKKDPDSKKRCCRGVGKGASDELGTRGKGHEKRTEKTAS